MFQMELSEIITRIVKRRKQKIETLPLSQKRHHQFRMYQSIQVCLMNSKGLHNFEFCAENDAGTTTISVFIIFYCYNDNSLKMLKAERE